MVRRGAIACVAVVVLLAACGNDDVSRSTSPLGPDGRVDVGRQVIETMSVSPDATVLAYLGSGQDTNRYRIALVHDGEVEVLAPRGGTVTSFGWMPDSKRLLVAYSDASLTSDNLRIVSIEGETLSTVPLDRELRVSDGVAVAPAGDLAVLGIMDPGQGAMPSMLVSVDLSTGHVVTIVEPETGSATSPAFVGDGKIVYTHVRAKNDSVLVELDLESGVPRELTAGGVAIYSSSATLDGRAIVFYGWDPGIQYRGVFVFRPDGGVAPELLGAGRPVAVAPNGSYFVVRDEDQLEIHYLADDG